MRRSGRPTPTKREARSRRYNSVVLFEASTSEAAIPASDKLMNVDGAVCVSSPAIADRADVYEVLEVRLLGDGDLIVVTPEK